MIGTLIARKALAESFDALNQHDLPRFMSAWRNDGVFIYPGEIPESGTFKGKSAVEGWFRRFFEQFPGIRFEIQGISPRNLFDFAGNNEMAVHWNLQLKNCEGREGKNSGVTVVSIQKGKVVLVKDFIFDLGENFKCNWSAS
jgi:ketosteroid isomerase-like protein